LKQYWADLACCDPQGLGFPRVPTPIKQGFHPVSPSRVIVVDDTELERFHRGHVNLRRECRETETKKREWWPGTPLLPEEKLDICVGLMERLTAYYHRSDLFPSWASLLWGREVQMSTGMGHGLGLLHDFQLFDAKVRTDNRVVDWWLVLIPSGVSWEALDERPVHIMVSPVMEKRQPRPYMKVMEALSRSLRPLVWSEGFDPASWATRLSRLSLADAARKFNSVVVQGLNR
jgi:hypothetical protein